MGVPRDFPIMERYYKDPKSNWSLNWTAAMVVGFAGMVAVMVLLWLMGAF